MSEAVLLDIAAHQPELIVFDSTVSLFHGEEPIAQAFYFAPREHNSTFERFKNEVIVSGFAILSDELLIFRLILFSSFFVFLTRGTNSAKFLVIVVFHLQNSWRSRE